MKCSEARLPMHGSTWWWYQSVFILIPPRCIAVKCLHWLETPVVWARNPVRAWLTLGIDARVVNCQCRTQSSLEFVFTTEKCAFSQMHKLVLQAGRKAKCLQQMPAQKSCHDTMCRRVRGWCAVFRRGNACNSAKVVF